MKSYESITYFRNRVQDNFIDLLKKNNIPYFVGGSKRFGYDCENSDLDIIISTEINGNIPINMWIHDFKNLGFKECVPEIRGVYQMDVVYVLGDIIHLCLLNKRQFEIRKDEHKKIENFLLSKENRNLINIIMKLKKERVSGSQIYRSLKALACL